MAGRGPAPKPSALRQRRNKATTKASLPSAAAAANNPVPELPPRQDGAAWHPRVVEWWESVWRSPMASEYLDADMRGGLYLLADLYQIRWTAASPAALIEAAKEIRLQSVAFGLTPIDRRRLQWEVEKGEEAAERTGRRKNPKTAAETKDPRAVLRAV